MEFFHLSAPGWNSFDVKFDGQHKCRLVANGAPTQDLDDTICSGVVSIRAVRLLLFISQLNGLQASVRRQLV